MMIDLESLNANQRLAVEWNEGPLLVLAGPGSGKTRVLTMRVAKLLLDSPSKRFRVLGLTFTKKAADEMRGRVEQMVPDCRQRVSLTTFHSFCADVLRQHGSHIGLSPDFVILNQDSDREGVLADALAESTDEEAAIDRGANVLPILDRLLAECVEHGQVAHRFRDHDFGRMIERLHSNYISKLIATNRVDFPCLLLFTLRLLNAKPAIAKQIRTVYPHVCVDEFQDTNLAQYQILKAIVGDSPTNLFVVADDDQIIYQWNGASPERLASLRADFGMHTIQLPANYRCPPEVITLANHLIKNNLERAADKEPLYAVRPSSGEGVVRLQCLDSLDAELEWVAADIVARHPTNTGNCVILARTRRVLEQAVAHLEQAGVPATLSIRKSEFVSGPIRWLHAVLRLANTRGDQEQLRRICKAFFEIDGVDISVQSVRSEAARIGGDLLRAWFDKAISRDELEPESREFLEKGKAFIVERLDFQGFISATLAWADLLDARLSGRSNEGYADYREEKESWNQLLQRAMQRYGRDGLTLNALLQDFDLSDKSPPPPPEAVRCLTIHTSKGMEFHHVYLVGMSEDVLPSFQSIKKGDQSRDMQEERRNCFVAITRTLETLTLTYAREYFGWPKQPSRFLREMGFEEL